MRLRTIALTTFATCALALSQSQAASILHYSFNETGTTAPSSGTNTTALNLRNDADTLTDLHGPAGSGVTGLAYDRSFRNFGPSAHGSNASAGTNGSRAEQADLDAIDTLQSFTLSGWYKTETTANLGSGTPRLFWNHNDGAGAAGAGFSLQFFSGSEDLKIDIDDDTAVVNTTGGKFADKQTWVFFAVTYDGTLTTNNLSFYKGYRNDAEALAGTTHLTAATQLISTHSLNRGTVNTEASGLHLGNRFAENRPFDGELDEMRIDGEKIGAGGALTLAQLEIYRQIGIGVPEPSSILLAGLAGALLIGFRLRRS